MNFLLCAVLGILLNSIGLCLFGEAIVHRAMANGAPAAGLLDGAIGLVLINLGIWLIAESVALRRIGPRRD